MNTSSNAQPNYFTLLRVVSILMGCIGLIGSAIILSKSIMLIMNPMAEVKGADIPVTDVIWLIQSLALIIAGVWILKLKQIGRISILICVLYSLITTIYYYLQVASTIPFLSLPSLLVISLCLVNALIFVYFMRRDVKAYIMAKR